MNLPSWLEHADHAAVVGLQWGDEGKGKVADLLTRRFDYVVRYNGGANAGHTIVVDDQRYALHLIPSGVLHEHITNVIANGVVIDPDALLKEMDDLIERGVPADQRLAISDRAHLVMPYHKISDGLIEAAIAHHRGDDKKIGTTGRGIGPTYADKAQRSTAIRVGDLKHMDRLAANLPHIVNVKNAMLEPLAKISGQSYSPINADELLSQLEKLANRIGPMICDTTEILHNARKTGKKILFEGANACMLDIDHGTFPFVTSSNASALGIYAGAAMPGNQMGQILGVAKAYTTRVGGGPFPTEQDNETGQAIRDRGNEYGTTTGRPRRCGWLDLVALKYAADICGIDHLAIMLLDVLAGFDKLQVCTGYQLHGCRLTSFPADVDDLLQSTPIYETLDGFSESITECRDEADLPREARKYIERIEQYIERPVSLISIGPDRAQTIFRQGC